MDSLLAALPVVAAAALIALLGLRGIYSRLRVFPSVLMTSGIIGGTRLGGQWLGLGEQSWAHWPIATLAALVGLTLAVGLNARLEGPTRSRAAAEDGADVRSPRAGG